MANPLNTSAGNAITLRVKLPQTPNSLAKVTTAIGEEGGDIGAIDIIRVEKDHIVRDFTINTHGDEHGEKIQESIEKLEGYEVLQYSDRTFLMHLGGKIEVKSKSPLKTRDELSMAYTPGVARVCTAIHRDPAKAWSLTIKRNTVAIVSDGTAVLGLGNIGPEAAMPVMEGKAMLFKEFGEVDAFPICLDTTDPDEIVSIVKALAPTFGGVNLEDIAAPNCFEIERRLKQETNIPIFHDDQHGTAVVMTGALINALKIVNKKAENLKVVVSGVGAAGTACSRMMMNLGIFNIIGVDSKGILHRDRDNLNDEKKAYVEMSNPENVKGSIHDAMKGADLFVGLSAPGVIDVPDLKNMNVDPIVFAMANPTPEIMPEIASPHVAVMATGRSDYPNQINNVLCFPGLFRGALDCQATDINEAMNMAAARAIANVIEEDSLFPGYVIPSVFDRNVAPAVTHAVVEAAIQTGVARRVPGNFHS